VRACLNRPRATRPRRAADRPRSKAVIWDRLNGDVWGEIEGAVLRAFAEDRWVVSGLEELAAATRGRRLVASYAVRGERDPLAARLHALGFDDPYEEVVVERSLEGELPPLRKQVTLEDPGTVPIAALAEALQGTANRGLQCLKAAELASFLDHGVDRRAGWRIARLRDQQVGVANLRVDEPGVASLGFMGLAPAWRGRGLGAALHAAALRDLAAQGAGHYRDATDVRNRAMRSVFFWNGCTVVGFTRHRSAP
jgi:ribosomal protein S18 acetylase RimI-like enzyme